MSYVHNDGRTDFFITFTCNPQCSEIKEHLFFGQSPIDRQKLRALMDFIVKGVQNWMYSVEWKRGLPNAHILIWLVRKITPDEIDTLISAEIPDQTIDPELYEIISKNMIHGPCGTFNKNSPCMVDGKCSMRYPRALVAHTITGNDEYPLYRRRSTENNGKSTFIKLKNEDFEVDNRWIVPHSPLLSKTFNAHITQLSR